METMMQGKVSIEPDERGFWHINFFAAHSDPGDDSATPDAFVTTKKGATRADAIALALEKFKPDSVTVWDWCDACDGSGVHPEDDDDTCEECEAGMVPTSDFETTPVN